FDGAPVGLDTDANVSNESESEGDNSFFFDDNSSILDLEPEQVADSLNDLDVDDDQDDDLTDWDLNLEDVDEGLSVIDRQQLFRKRIAHWAVDTNVSRDSVNKLLAVFRTDPSLSFLPKNYKTLLGTPRKVNTVEVSPGRYFEFNVLDGITSSLDLLNASFESRDVVLKIKIGCDGMPASKSTNSQFWPILGLIVMEGAKPFEIGFYHGHSKPDHPNDYLRHFHTEITNLIENGFHYKESNVKIEIAGFCCDAPALSFIKLVKPCGAYYCCMKCETEGEYVFNGSGRGGRVTFPVVDAVLRTDESFRNRDQIFHHVGLSILESLPIDMIECFFIDPMHLVFLGCMKKLLNIWVNERKRMRIRMSSQQIAEISRLLVAIEELIPVEFSRKTRTLNELSRFKATELRLLLLYVLPFVLKNRIPDEVYQHFMLLHVAIRILSCDQSVRSEENTDYANILLITFINQSPGIYGDSFITYNIHNLCHLSEECRRLGGLESFSCFVFENHLGTLKNLLKKSAKPLEQLVNRIMEKRQNPPVVTNFRKNPDMIKLIDEHSKGPLLPDLHGLQYNKAFFHKLRLSSRSPNNCVVLADDTVILIHNFLQLFDGEILIIGRKFLVYENFLDLNGLDSKAIGIQIVDTLATNLECWPLKSVRFKSIKLPVIHKAPPTSCFGIVRLMNFDLSNI
ncbi:uncharacterized protein LOC116918962, partial [Daphnia magna]|uniref:uncharacterized protein LOC116918962 n=1 Tax=Daphnia magna TaxID=35525 RepID=UPI001E1BD081